VSRTVWPGAPFPLGPSWDGSGTNFSLFSENAQRVELCLFDDQDREERIDVRQQTAHNWHVYLPGVGPGQRYGYRVDGPWEPEQGHRFNPAKLLIDPYAKSIDGPIGFGKARLLAYVPGQEDVRDDEDSAPAIPRSVVIDDAFDWEGDVRLDRPWPETVIYELHVKGFTKRLPGVREDLRGTYAGLASDAAIAYLSDLGITAVELLPVHHIADEDFLVARGLSNYWGYSTIGFFAPHSGYAATGSRGEQVREFKGMVKALHRAGIEVILDVVYNHTAEGSHLGPTLSFKGVDNAAYYRLMPDDRRHYMYFTGTGNSLNPVNPSVLRLVMDSLRYFVMECHVDGFRFDLASALARELYDVDQLSAFFDIIHQDPVLSQVKLIAEPWDVGPGGYQVGNFPILWSEWNGMYRDTMRDFWRGHTAVAEFARRFTGSSDLYQSDGRHPSASINFVTCHDGFTLRDLVSYDRKHNEANLEDNRDGSDDNRSWNCGVEGETDDPDVNELRDRQTRNILATLLLSQGTPMLLAGDELRRTQRGNNNAYCQDNELSWLDWDVDERGQALLEFTKRLLRLRGEHPVFRRSAFLTGEARQGSGAPDVWWFRPDGRRVHARRVPERLGDPDADLRRRAGRRRLLHRPLQRVARSRHVRAAAHALRPPLGARALHGRARAAAERLDPFRAGAGAASRSRAQGAAAGRLTQLSVRGGCFRTRRQTWTTSGSNCVPPALTRRRKASSTGSASR
jgi:isoamylase